jgi:hypothetical protein
MNKGEGKGPELPSWRRFFYRHRAEIIEMAWRLYALAPFADEEWGDASRWRALICRAATWLHNAHTAYDEVDRGLKDEAVGKAEKQSAKFNRLPELIPYKRAVALITGNRHANALRTFEQWVESMPREWFGVLTGRQLIERWRKEGIPRRNVIELQAEYKRAKAKAKPKSRKKSQ